jgi:ADP-ribose pyrophosphatase YjhB (NUDIX family)
MSATVRLSDTEHAAGWILRVNGVDMPRDTEWSVQSKFGSVQTAVVLDKDGKPVFDRPSYHEAPNVNLVVWGRNRAGEVKIAVIRQPRPHADNPQQSPELKNESIVFGQTPMGFAEKVLGESPEDAARRETNEETGAKIVLSIERPKCPWHNPNPTFVATWSDLLFVQVDLEKIEELKSTRNEPIFSAEFISPAELIHRVCEGEDDHGAMYRMCTTNSVWFIFFCVHPELFVA